jgi:AraC-like DNA-binding protein
MGELPVLSGYEYGPQPIVMQANYRQFASCEEGGEGELMRSRTLAWCRGGAGQVRVGDVAMAMTEGDAFLAPWEAAHVFKADRTAPFHFAAVHLIPHLASGGLVDYHVMASTPEIAEVYAQRQDAALPGLADGLIRFRLSESHRLAHLMHYAIMWFERPERDEGTARELARMLLRELTELGTDATAAWDGYPKALQQMLTHIDWDYDHLDGLSELEGVGSCSRSTICRLFRRHLDCTPTAWLLSVRLKQAARLLQSTNLRAYEVGRRVGIGNPYYFSRVFKRRFGVTPGEFRKGVRGQARV